MFSIIRWYDLVISWKILATLVRIQNWCNNIKILYSNLNQLNCFQNNYASVYFAQQARTSAYVLNCRIKAQEYTSACITISDTYFTESYNWTHPGIDVSWHVSWHVFFCHVLPCMTTRPIPGKNIQDYYPPINLSVTDIKPNQFGVIDSVLPDLSYWSVLVIKPTDQGLTINCKNIGGDSDSNLSLLPTRTSHSKSWSVGGRPLSASYIFILTNIHILLLLSHLTTILSSTSIV